MSAAKKKYSKSLMVLLVFILALLVVISYAVLRGFHTFNTFKPDTSNVGPATPGFP